MQFHTEVSFNAMVFTSERSYARLRSAQTCAQEEIELEAFQREVYASVPVPPGANDIPCYPDHIDSRIPGMRHPGSEGVTYYAIIDDLSSRDRPASVLRRSYHDGGRRDEAFTRDLAWHRSSLLISAERGDLENEFVEITADDATRIVDRITQSVTATPRPRGQSCQLSSGPSVVDHVPVPGRAGAHGAVVEPLVDQDVGVPVSHAESTFALGAVEGGQLPVDPPQLGRIRLFAL